MLFLGPETFYVHNLTPVLLFFFFFLGFTVLQHDFTYLFDYHLAPFFLGMWIPQGQGTLFCLPLCL